MHVVHVIISLHVGGAEHMLKRLLLSQRASQSASRSTVVSLTSIGPIGESMLQANIEVVALGLRTAFDVPLATWRLIRLLRKLRPHLVQTWMVHADLIGGLAARLAGIRHVVWGVRRTDYALTQRSTRAIRWVCARLSKCVPQSIVCAAESARRAQIAAGYDPHRMVVIPNGFDTDVLRPAADVRTRMRHELAIPSGALVVGCVGRYDPAKDHANFISAAAAATLRDERLLFLMVGRGLLEDNPALMKLIDSTGLRHRFILLGERSDVCNCMNAMDMFVLSSRSEAFPNVVGEAMAVGLPCAVTDVGDAAQLVGDAGLVVEPANPHALADAIVRLALLPTPERVALGERARMRISNEYSLRATAMRFSTLYQRLVNGADREVGGT